jgi:hypothetical protein
MKRILTAVFAGVAVAGIVYCLKSSSRKEQEVGQVYRESTTNLEDMSKIGDKTGKDVMNALSEQA